LATCRDGSSQSWTAAAFGDRITSRPKRSDERGVVLAAGDNVQGVGRDVPRGVDIGVDLELAMLANKVSLVLAIGLLAMAAFAAPARRVLRIDEDHGHAGALRLVGHETAKLRETPIAEPASKCPPNQLGKLRCMFIILNPLDGVAIATKNLASLPATIKNGVVGSTRVNVPFSFLCSTTVDVVDAKRSAVIKSASNALSTKQIKQGFPNTPICSCGAFFASLLLDQVRLADVPVLVELSFMKTFGFFANNKSPTSRASLIELWSDTGDWATVLYAHDLLLVLLAGRGAAAAIAMPRSMPRNALTATGGASWNSMVQ
jgi:hypothetical protein